VQTFDVFIHDTYFVVAHFHYVLAGSVLFGAFAFVYFWFPKISGRLLNTAVGQWHFWLTFALFNLAFFPMFLVGLQGHMRRIADATAYEFLKPIQGWNVFMGWVTLALVAVQGLFFANVVWALFKGKRAPANPWEAASLSWTVASPPPWDNFETLPQVFCGPHEYGVPSLKERDWLAQNDPTASALARS
jgi:cytochrome c oxidase subunit 1